VRLVLPLPPNRANARGHWRKSHGQQKEYVQKLDHLQLFGRVPPPPKAPLMKARISATLYVWSPMDQGNALNRLKWVEDWLVSRGYILDDAPDVLEWTGIPRQVVDRQDQRVVLELEAA
jgi:hypothetical protein